MTACSPKFAPVFLPRKCPQTSANQNEYVQVALSSICQTLTEGHLLSSQGLRVTQLNH